MKPAEYLVLAGNAIYHYTHKQDLLCDIARIGPEDVRIFKRADSGFVIRYVPTTEAELRGKAA